MATLINREDVIHHIEDCTVCNSNDLLSADILSTWTREELNNYVINSHADFPRIMDSYTEPNELSEDEVVELMTT